MQFNFPIREPSCPWLVRSLVVLLGTLLAPQGHSEDESTTESYLHQHEVSTFFPRHVDSDLSIQVDGHLTESIWQDTTAHSEFYLGNRDPNVLVSAEHKTEVRTFYTEDGIYVGATMYQTKETDTKILSAHDQFVSRRDYFTLVLDTSGEGRYGYYFSIALGDSKSEGTIQLPRNFSGSWTGAWWGRTKPTNTGWTSEFFIPWNVMRLVSGDQTRTIGIHYVRGVGKVDHYYTWPYIHQSWSNYMGLFQPMQIDGVATKQQLAWFPTLTHSSDEFLGTSESSAGLDVFWRPSSNLLVNSTLNPDFGTVESDNIIINLSAFESFFSENRLFFREGQEIFEPSHQSNRGRWNPPIVPLHTGRIGSAPVIPESAAGVRFKDHVRNQTTDIDAATKVTGTTGKIAYGVLTALESDTEMPGTLWDEPVTITAKGKDFVASRFQYEGGGEGIRNVALMTTHMRHPERESNMYAIDHTLLTDDGKYGTIGQIMRSESRYGDTDVGGLIQFHYQPVQTANFQASYRRFGEDFDINDVGFTNLRNSQSASISANVQNFDVLNTFRATNTQLSYRSQRNLQGDRIGGGFFGSTFFEFNNRNVMWIGAGYNLSTIDDRNSFGNGNFRVEPTRWYGFDLGNDQGKRYSFYGWIARGTESIGGYVFDADLSIWLRPVDRFRVGISSHFTDRTGELHHTFDRTFTGYHRDSLRLYINSQYFINADQSVRVDLQYEGYRATAKRSFYTNVGSPELIEEFDVSDLAYRDFDFSFLNLQIRYRWQIAPLSDLFIVYTLGGRLDSGAIGSYSSALRDTFEDRISEFLVVKLRYRFGSESRISKIFQRNKRAPADQIASHRRNERFFDSPFLRQSDRRPWNLRYL